MYTKAEKWVLRGKRGLGDSKAGFVSASSLGPADCTAQPFPRNSAAPDLRLGPYGPFEENRSARSAFWDIKENFVPLLCASVFSLHNLGCFLLAQHGFSLRSHRPLSVRRAVRQGVAQEARVLHSAGPKGYLRYLEPDLQRDQIRTGHAPSAPSLRPAA